MNATDIDPKVFEAIVESVSERLRRARVKLWQVDDGYDVPTLLQPWKFGDVGEVDLHHLVLSVVESTLSHIEPPITPISSATDDARRSADVERERYWRKREREEDENGTP